MLKRNIYYHDPQDPEEPREQTSTPLEEFKTKPKKLVFFWIFVILATSLSVLFVRAIVRGASNSNNSLSPRQTGLFQTVRNYIFKPELVLDGEAVDRVNILLLGIGGPGHDGAFLSDTNIILSIKPSTREVALISVPRDLGVKVGSHGWRKINSADAFGEAEIPGNGGEYTRQIFESTFNMKIPYYVRVDFKAFSELIDELGGVTVNVPVAFTDSSFPLGETTDYTTIHFDAGIQTMDGKTALSYARSRHGNHGEASDFARSRRQQLILEAIKTKMLSLGTYANPGRLQEMYDSLTSHVTTNLNIAQLAYLASTAKDINQTKSLVLDNAPGGYLISTTGESGAFLLSPKDGDFNVINTAIENVFSPSSTSKIAIGGAPQLPGNTNVKLEVENGTWIPGLAARADKKLSDHGLKVINIGNSLKRPIAQTAIYVLNSSTDKGILTSLTQFIGVSPASVTSSIPTWLQDSYDDPATSENEQGMKYNKDADVLIILGSDFKE